MQNENKLMQGIFCNQKYLYNSNSKHTKSNIYVLLIMLEVKVRITKLNETHFI